MLQKALEARQTNKNYLKRKLWINLLSRQKHACPKNHVQAIRILPKKVCHCKWLLCFFYVEFYKSLKKASIFLRLDVSFLHISEVNFISLPWTLTRPMGPRRKKERQCISKLDEVEIMQDIEHNIIKSSIEKTFLCGHT